MAMLSAFSNRQWVYARGGTTITYPLAMNNLSFIGGTPTSTNWIYENICVVNPSSSQAQIYNVSENQNGIADKKNFILIIGY